MRSPKPCKRAALGLLASLALLASAPGASALIVRAGGATLSYEPLPHSSISQASPLSVKAVEYHGGPVMPSNTNYAIYWAPGGASQYQTGYTSGIDRYFEDLAHDSGGLLNTDSLLQQYGDKAGEFADYSSHFGGAGFDTDPYPASGCSAAATCFTEEQLRGEIAKYVAAQKLPTDLQHEYFLLTPAGVDSCLEAASRACSAGASHAVYCAYHGYITAASGVIVYANVPYMLGTNCDTGEEHPGNAASDATLGGGLVHEHSESLTDPELTAWYDAKGEEVGDKCRTLKLASEFGEPLGTAPDGSRYNQVIDGDLYWYQQEWSNEAGGCAQRLAQAPTTKKMTPKSGPASGGTVVTITGAAFVGSVAVKFGETASPQVTVGSSTSLTAVAPPGALGTVDVTVTTQAGTSPINGKVHFKYKKR